MRRKLKAMHGATEVWIRPHLRSSTVNFCLDKDGQTTDGSKTDDQKVQLYELMTEIRKRELEENDPEFTPQQ